MGILSKQLETHPRDFDFFQVIRLLENKNLLLDSISKPIFSPTSVYDIKKTENTWHITSGFMGLYGPHGLLPEDFLEVIHATEIKPYLDSFGTKILMLYYQAWKKNKFYLFDENKNSFYNLKKIFLSYLGITTENYYEKFFNKNEGLFPFIKYFKSKSLSAGNLKKLLSSYFNIQIVVDEFFIKTQKIPKEQCTYLSSQKNNFNHLGQEALLGKKIKSSFNIFRVKLSFLSEAIYNEFLPFCEKQKTLQEIIHYFFGLNYQYDIQLAIKTCEISPLYLKKSGQKQLGWNTWLRANLEKSSSETHGLRIAIGAEERTRTSTVLPTST